MNRLAFQPLFDAKSLSDRSADHSLSQIQDTFELSNDSSLLSLLLSPHLPDPLEIHLLDQTPMAVGRTVNYQIALLPSNTPLNPQTPLSNQPAVSAVSFTIRPGSALKLVLHHHQHQPHWTIFANDNKIPINIDTDHKCTSDTPLQLCIRTQTESNASTADIFPARLSIMDTPSDHQRKSQQSLSTVCACETPDARNIVDISAESNLGSEVKISQNKILAFSAPVHAEAGYSWDASFDPECAFEVIDSSVDAEGKQTILMAATGEWLGECRVTLLYRRSWNSDVFERVVRRTVQLVAEEGEGDN